MAVHIQKPAFNLRDKLNSLDYKKLPYDKMPHGTLVQTQLVSRVADTSSTSTSWHDIDEMRFTYKFEDSTLLISANYSMGGQSGTAYRLGLDVDDDIDGTASGRRQLTRSGLHRINSSSDAFQTRVHFMFWYKPRAWRMTQYWFKGENSNTSRVWYHTYGDQTRSYFMIQEFRGIINGISDGGENWDIGDLT